MRKHRQYIVRSLKMYLRCFFGKFTEDIMLRKLNNYFTTFEKILWIGSLVLITGSAVMFGKDGILSVIASLIGATSLLLNAKGNPIGQALGVIFSILYAIISFSFAYYGEMITYLGLTGPMALAAFISWIRNPFAKGKAEVKVNHIHRGEVLYVHTHRRCHRSFLLRTRLFQHGKSYSEYRFRHNELPRRISHIPPQPFLRCRLCRK